MSKSVIKISDISEIYDTVSAISSKYKKLNSDEKLSMFSSLCIEELLTHILNNNAKNVEIRVRGFWQKYIEILAENNEDFFFSGNDDNKILSPEKTADKILNHELLARFFPAIKYSYDNGKSRYKIYPKKLIEINLTEEILDYYEYNSDEKSEEKSPLGLVKHLAKNHKFTAFMAIFTRFTRHLAALSLPYFASNIIQAIIDYNTIFNETIYLNVIFSLIALALNLIFVSIENDYYQTFVRKLEAGLRVAIVKKIQTLNAKFQNTMPSGKILSKMSSDVMFIKLLFFEYFSLFVIVPEDLLFVILISLFKLPEMLLIFAILVPLDVYLLYRFTKPIAGIKLKMRRASEQLTAYFKELLATENLSRAQGGGKREVSRMEEYSKILREREIVHDYYQVVLNNIGYGAAQGFKLLVLCIGVYLVSIDEIEIGEVVLFQFLFDMIVNSVQKFLETMPQITQGVDSFYSVHEILNQRDIEENGDVVLNDFNGKIEFKNVSFVYDNDDNEGEKSYLLNNINLEIPAKKTVAFVGASGGGKSTILSLILGLYNPQKGEILIDGKNIKTLSKKHYRRFISLVPQTPILFSGTLWENLICGNINIGVNEVTNILHRVNLDDLYMNHPQGLNMPIIEGGLNLSGGQRQRIAIARAMLREPKLILMDEATSALDTASEIETQKAIDEAAKNSTCVLVAHRINTIKKADIIYEVINGKVVKYDSFSDYEKQKNKKDEMSASLSK